MSPIHQIITEHTKTLIPVQRQGFMIISINLAKKYIFIPEILGPSAITKPFLSLLYANADITAVD